MSRVSRIPIRILPVQVVSPGAETSSGGLGGGVVAILAELAALLDGLTDREEGGTVDLRSLPMGPQDRAQLQQVLGEGEVHATLDAEGLSRFQETGVPGIWWIEHRDRSGELVAELIEVAAMPAILVCARDEIAAGRGVLRSRVAALDSAVGKGGR